MAVDPTHPDRTFRATAPGEPARVPPRPPGEHGVVDPADVSPEPVRTPDAHAVSDAEGELLVTEAANAGPTWASSRVIAGAVGLVLIGVVCGVGYWLYDWVDDEAADVIAPTVVVEPAAPAGAAVTD